MTDLSQLKTSEQAVFMGRGGGEEESKKKNSKAISKTGIIRTEAGALLYQAEIS